MSAYTDAMRQGLEKTRGMPKVYLNPAQKYAKKATRKSAIDAKCFDCEGEDADIGWKWRIGNCPITTCSLWSFRPYRYMCGRPAPRSVRGG